MALYLIFSFRLFPGPGSRSRPLRLPPDALRDRGDAQRGRHDSSQDKTVQRTTAAQQGDMTLMRSHMMQKEVVSLSNCPL